MCLIVNILGNLNGSANISCSVQWNIHLLIIENSFIFKVRAAKLPDYFLHPGTVYRLIEQVCDVAVQTG